MLLSTTDFLAMGFRATSEDTALVDRAIKDTELFFLKNVVGESLYASMLMAQQGTDIYDAVNGTPTMAGIKQAIGHYAFALMLVDNVNFTRTGSVKKRDDYSQPASEDDIYKMQRYHWTIAKRYIDEVCAFLDVRPNYDIDYLNEYKLWNGQQSWPL